MVIQQLNACTGERKKGREMLVHPLLAITARSLVIPRIIDFNKSEEAEIIQTILVLQDKKFWDHLMV